MNLSVSIAWSNKHVLYSLIHGSNAAVSFPVSLFWVPGKEDSSWPRETLPIIRVYSVMSDSVALQAPLSMGILQARILEWVAISFFRRSTLHRDLTQVSCIADGFFTTAPFRKCKGVNLPPQTHFRFLSYIYSHPIGQSKGSGKDTLL